MQLADADPAERLRPVADAEVDEVLAHAGPLDEPDVVAEVVADAEQRVLRVDAVVVPRHRALPGELAAVDAGRRRPGEERIDAERADEAEVRVDADDAVAIARQSGRLARQEDRADVGVAQDVAAAAQDRVVVAVALAERSGLNRHRADAEPSDPSSEASAGLDRNLVAELGQADPPREEQQHLLFRRREARVAQPRLARDVAEVEHAGVLEEELALLRKVEAELGQVDLLLV